MTSVTSGRGVDGEDAAGVSLLVVVVVAMVEMFVIVRDDLFASISFIERLSS